MTSMTSILMIILRHLSEQFSFHLFYFIMATYLGLKDWIHEISFLLPKVNRKRRIHTPFLYFSGVSLLWLKVIEEYKDMLLTFL